MSESRIQYPSHEEVDPSLLEVNQAALLAWRGSRPVKLDGDYFKVKELLGDPYLSEMVWIMCGKDSLRMINWPLKALNGDRHWWEIWRKKNTIVSLAGTRSGKLWVWQMLHDAGGMVIRERDGMGQIKVSQEFESDPCFQRFASFRR